MPDTDEWVEMTHPASADEPPALVTKAAFDLHWEPKGWAIAGQSGPERAPAPANRPTVTSREKN